MQAFRSNDPGAVLHALGTVADSFQFVSRSLDLEYVPGRMVLQETQRYCSSSQRHGRAPELAEEIR